MITGERLPALVDPPTAQMLSGLASQFSEFEEFQQRISRAVIQPETPALSVLDEATLTALQGASARLLAVEDLSARTRQFAVLPDLGALETLSRKATEVLTVPDFDVRLFQGVG